MTKLACVLMGLAFILMGVLGITGLAPMFQTDPVYVNLAEILLGGLGLVVGIYARKNSGREQKAKDLSRQAQDSAARQRQDYDQLKKENDQGKKDTADRQSQENDQLRKENEQQKKENDQLKKHNA